MKYDEVIQFLQAHGSEQNRRIYRNHGVKGKLYGVKVADLKIVQKKIKKDYSLSLKLYETGNYDAMYLAGLIADEEQMSKEELDGWMTGVDNHLIPTYAVAPVAAKSSYGLALARKWMQSKDEFVAAGGYATYIDLISKKSKDELDLKEIESILDHIVEVIHQERNQVRYQMNAFVIAAGGYIPSLSDKARDYGNTIGKVKVDMGNTACKVPLITPYIDKMIARNEKKKKKT